MENPNGVLDPGRRRCRLSCGFVTRGVTQSLFDDQKSWLSTGGRTRTRTLDPLIKSQLLYQLSYAPGMPRQGPAEARIV